MAEDNVTIGVGDGSGQLFVHGSYDAIKQVQRFIFTTERHTWRPISTAPRDGSVFMTYMPPCIANNGDPIDARYDYANWDEELGDFIQHGCGWYDTTHWMPLPAPPA